MMNYFELRADGMYLNGKLVTQVKDIDVRGAVGDVTEVSITFHAKVLGLDYTTQGHEFGENKE